MSQTETTNYSTTDLSLAAYLYALGTPLVSVQARRNRSKSRYYFSKKNSECVQIILGFINSTHGQYDQILRILKKIILGTKTLRLIGSEGSWSINRKLPVVAYICLRGGRIVGFRKIESHKEEYEIYFDGDGSWYHRLEIEYESSEAKSYDDAILALKRIVSGKDSC